jgi:hypothetical protein
LRAPPASPAVQRIVLEHRELIVAIEVTEPVDLAYSMQVT